MGYTAGGLTYSPGPCMGIQRGCRMRYGPVPKRGNMYYYPIYYYIIININITHYILYHHR